MRYVVVLLLIVACKGGNSCPPTSETKPIVTALDADEPSRAIDKFTAELGQVIRPGADDGWSSSHDVFFAMAFDIGQQTPDLARRKAPLTRSILAQAFLAGMKRRGVDEERARRFYEAHAAMIEHYFLITWPDDANERAIVKRTRECAD